MLDAKYANAYQEVLEILKYIPKEDYLKIPKDKIELFETNANHAHPFTYNPDKTLTEQNVSKLAKGMIAILFRDYWATESQREKIRTKQNQDRQRIEKEKSEIYQTNPIFPKQNKAKEKEDYALVGVSPEKWYEKMVSFFRKFWKKQK